MDGMKTHSSEAEQLRSWLLQRSLWSVLGISLSLGFVSFAAAPALSQAMGTATTGLPGNSVEALMRPTLKLGSKGADVTELQATLKLLGYYDGTVDGVYGQSTATAVAQFQQAAGLSTDGIAGPATWTRLFPPTPDAAIAASLPPASGVAPATRAPSSDNSAASFPMPGGISPVPASSTPMPAANPRPVTPASGVSSTPKPSKPMAGNRPTATTSTTSAEPVTLPILRQGMKGSAVVALQERLRTIGILKDTADGTFGAVTLAAVKAAQQRFKLEPDGVVGPATWSALLR